MERIDVAVIGVGAMGSAALWRLATRGARAVGFEQFAPPHDLGSSHGESRIIRTAYFEDPRYVPLIRRAFVLWRELEAESGVALLTMTGALMIGRPDSAVVAGTLASVREHGLAHEELDAATMERRYPQHVLSADEVAVYEADAGYLRPEAAVAAMAGRAEALGATLHRQARVEEIDATGEGVRLTVAGRTYQARHAIVSVGAWLGAMLPGIALPLRVERQVLAWFPLRDRELYDPRRCPVYIRDVPPDRHRYGFPTLDGATVKVAVHHEGAMTSADEIDRTVNPTDVAPVSEFARRFLRGVEPVAARSVVCMYTNTPDEHFVVGALPGLPGVTLLGGFSGHGFKFAPVIGDVAADLALSGGTAYPIGLFAPARFAALP